MHSWRGYTAFGKGCDFRLSLEPEGSEFARSLAFQAKKLSAQNNWAYFGTKVDSDLWRDATALRFRVKGAGEVIICLRYDSALYANNDTSWYYTISLTSQWREYTIPFADFAKKYSGQRGPDMSAVKVLLFVLEDNGAKNYLDDLKLVMPTAAFYKHQVKRYEETLELFKRDLDYLAGRRFNAQGFEKSLEKLKQSIDQLYVAPGSEKQKQIDEVMAGLQREINIARRAIVLQTRASFITERIAFIEAAKAGS